MIEFVLVTAVLLVVSLLWLLRPLLGKAQANGVLRSELNASIYRDDLARLETDQASGLLDAAGFAVQLNELQHRLLQDTDAPALVARLKAPKFTVGVIVLCVPLLAVSLYLHFGSPANIGSDSGHAPTSRSDIEQMVSGLAKKLANEPDNLQGWAMLARSYKAMHRSADAEQAFVRAGSYLDGDAQALADYADVLASNHQGDFSGKPQALIKQALQLNPDSLMALWLAGTAAYQQADYAQALRYWEHLEQLLPPDSDDARSIQASLDDARAKGNLPPTIAPTRVAPAAASPALLSGTVDIDAALKSHQKSD